MGEITKITCRECGTEWTINTGMGMLHGSPQAIKEEFPAEMGNKIDKMFREGGGDVVLENIFFSFKSAICQDCKRIVSIPVLSLNKEDTEKTLSGPCPDCGEKNMKIIKNLKKTPCPRCGKTALESGTTGFWD